ncbi:hypothetical protein Zm00014a_034058 [Zea mays]|uniref:Uncharacterized protein n=1 Tax=Zea mays TaxID=4577 RepID=A0A3L6DE56_MAIZE|nr:uncharacterized protein LOC100382131 isoform 1 [Zea mays]PWZ05831.1 hypothetical protein Zm00014a_034058 [Zea mays]|eukprot:NP_001305183.1 uncharacterized protein LOC100382131 isoform 1 [Zea mays]
MQPTTTTEIWQWQCGTCRADWKMMRQLTTCCPHVGRCCQGQGAPPPPSAGNPPHCHCHHHHHHHHRHRHHQEQGTTTAAITTTGRALAAGAEGSNAGSAGRHTTIATLNPAAPPAVAEVFWDPDPYLMVQQLREFETLNDGLVALRVQLQEYAEEISKSKDTNAGMDWLLALPASVRDVVIMARDVIESFFVISTGAAPP